MSYATEHQTTPQFALTGLLFHVNLSPSEKASKIIEHQLLRLACASKCQSPVILHPRNTGSGFLASKPESEL
jgi:hypothetical protein